MDPHLVLHAWQEQPLHELAEPLEGWKHLEPEAAAGWFGFDIFKFRLVPGSMTMTSMAALSSHSAIIKAYSPKKHPTFEAQPEFRKKKSRSDLHNSKILTRRNLRTISGSYILERWLNIIGWSEGHCEVVGSANFVRFRARILLFSQRGTFFSINGIHVNKYWQLPPTSPTAAPRPSNRDRWNQWWTPFLASPLPTHQRRLVEVMSGSGFLLSKHFYELSWQVHHRNCVLGDFPPKKKTVRLRSSQNISSADKQFSLWKGVCIHVWVCLLQRRVFFLICRVCWSTSLKICCQNYYFWSSFSQ